MNEDKNVTAYIRVGSYEQAGYKKYQLQTLKLKGSPRNPYPTTEQVRERLTEVNAVDHGHDELLGAYVVCDEKPRDFEEYGAYWVEI